MLNVFRVFGIIFIGSSLLAAAPIALACECPDTSEPPPCARFWRSSIVFTALVTQIDQTPDTSGIYPKRVLVRLKVLKIFKGTISEEIVDSQGHEIDCRGVYESGQQYLIYANDFDKVASKVTTMPCFGRIKVSHSTKDFEYIHQLTSHLAQSSITGRVLRGKYKPLGQIKIAIEGMGKTYETCTDNQGRYSMIVDRPGKYRITVVGPFVGASFSYGADNDSRKTSLGVQYQLDLEKGQCDYREVTVLQTQ
jgi:hypothetical protein